MYTLNSVEVHAVAYGVVTKGNGDAFLSKERHTALSAGGGQAGQGYPCVCYGLDTYNQNAEKELMPTIRTNGGGDCIPKVAYSIDKAITTGANCTAGGDCSHREYVPPLTTDRPHAVVYAVENHPNDSRVKLAEDDIVQALTSRMGTGGGNVPLVLFRKSRRAQNKDDFETWKEDNVTNTMNTFDRGDIRCTDAVVCKK